MSACVVEPPPTSAEPVATRVSRGSEVRISAPKAPRKPGEFTASSEILPHLVQGDCDGVLDSKFLRDRRITHVVTMGYVAPSEDIVQHQDLRICEIDVKDTPSGKLDKHFDEAVRFIHEGRSSGGSVYVHCYSGISRSSTIVAAYLMAWLDVTYREALRFVRAQRPCADPNPSFKKQLRDFEGSESMQKLHTDLLKLGSPDKSDERLKEDLEVFSRILKNECANGDAS